MGSPLWAQWRSSEGPWQDDWSVVLTPVLLLVSVEGQVQGRESLQALT